MENLTPLMRQYHQIKKQYSDAILLFRLGDFYEMFGDDALLASRLLEITLTSRHKVPMCGVPHHAAQSYIERLIKKGHSVAICEQMEEAGKTKNIVNREVTRVITPGTILEDNLLQAKNNNFLASIYFGKKTEPVGLAFVDISTGDFYITELSGKYAIEKLKAELSRFRPSECLLPESHQKNDLVDFMKRDNIFVNYYKDWSFDYGNAFNKLTKQLSVISLKGFGCADMDSAISASGSIISYLEETQKTSLKHINRVQPYSTDDFMTFDESTLNNLELTQSLYYKTSHGTLLDVLDHTVTSAGARLLRHALLHPLVNIEAIDNRLSIIETLYNYTIILKELRDQLAKTYDIQRLISRLNSGTARPRDLISLKKSLDVVPVIKKTLISEDKERVLQHLADELHILDDISALIGNSIVEEPPATLDDGGVIKDGYDSHLDELRSGSRQGKDWIIQLEQAERQRTGINSLKVGYTSVFGYYIEVTRSNLSSVPDDYTRKQTLVNAERFTTPALKEKEHLILGAEEKTIALEKAIFNRVCKEIIKSTKNIQETARVLANLDFLTTLSFVARQNNYVKPSINTSDTILITNGRHPVVERMLSDEKFVANDTLLNGTENQILIITGPNMAGKSTYIRQVALIVLMAQTGSFVPADKAEIGLVDSIFTRIGARENLAKGESTFMVEMNETANILNNATQRSLIILDEVGRGTSTFDGISIAWATVEHLYNMRRNNKNTSCKGAPRTLFATHYFELTELAQTMPGIKNYNIAVKEWNNRIIFLRKVIEGSTDKSYGIHVAKLAGIPQTVIERATEILQDLEKMNYRDDGVPKLAKSDEETKQLQLFVENYQWLISEVENIDINSITPLNALTTLQRLQEQLNKERGDL